MADDLAGLILRYTQHQPGESPFVTAIEGVTILRSDHPKPLSHMILRPALCITVQGAKWTAFGEKRFEYAAGQALVVGVEMPAVGQVTEASPSEPYLGIVLELDLGIMREVLEELERPPVAAESVQHGVFVSDFAGPIAACAARTVQLLDTPQAIAPLYPAVMREICFWLLTGPHGGEVAKMALGSDRTRRLVGAVHALRDHYARSIKVDELAAIAQLSPSAFHRQFKALTAMTPVQYQKQLRLHEARRLWRPGKRMLKQPPSGWAMKARRNSAANILACSEPRRDVTWRRFVSSWINEAVDISGAGLAGVEAVQTAEKCEVRLR